MTSPAPGPRLKRNVALLSLQVVVASVTLFLVYRHVIAVLGLAALGTWSLVFAITAFGRVAEFGVGQGVSRFVAEAWAEGRVREAVGTVYAALLIVGALIALVALLVLPFTHGIATRLVPTDAAAAARLLPAAVLVFALANVAAVYQAGVDGLQRADLRAVIGAVANVAQLVAAWLLVRPHGLLGLAASQVVMYVVMLLGTATVVHRRIGVRAVPAWREVLRVLRFGLPLQVSAVCIMLLEPTTKLLLGAYGTLVDVGVYELASRLVQQVRAAVVGGLPALTPAVAAMRGDAAAADRVEGGALRVLGVVVGAGVPALVAALPLVSVLWLGELRWTFVGYAAVLALGWGVNSLAVPRYYRLLGEGRVRLTVIAHVVMGAANFLLGLAAGALAGAWGVVGGSTIALILGGLVILGAVPSLADASTTRLSAVLPGRVMALGLAGAGVALATVWRAGPGASLAVGLAGIVVVVAYWLRSPELRRLAGGLAT